MKNKFLMFGLSSLILAGCGGSKVAVVENPVDMSSPADGSFQMTAPLAQWKMNNIEWKDAKNHAKGITVFKKVSLTPPEGEPPYRHYAWGWRIVDGAQCDAKEKITVKLFLETVSENKVQSTSEMALNKPSDVDPVHYTYNLRVEVDNPGNCGAIVTGIAVAATR